MQRLELGRRSLSQRLIKMDDSVRESGIKLVELGFHKIKIRSETIVKPLKEGLHFEKWKRRGCRTNF